MSQQNQGGAAAAPQTIDVSVLLAQLIASQAESAALQRKLLEREIAKDDAIARKDAEAAAKIERDRKQLHDQMKLKIENDERRQKDCPHTDQRQGSTIYPISNRPHLQLEGTCTRCGIHIQPAHFEVDAAGKKTLIPEHPLYRKVVERDFALYSAFTPTTGY